jgi:hypothetical protein
LWIIGSDAVWLRVTAVLVVGTTSVPKTTIHPPQPQTQVPSWKYSVGHVFESARSSFTRPKDSSAKDDAQTTTPDDDGGLEGLPYSQSESIHVQQRKLLDSTLFDANRI